MPTLAQLPIYATMALRCLAWRADSDRSDAGHARYAGASNDEQGLQVEVSNTS